MPDHGDDVAEFVLNRSFNQYTARESIRFILEASKRRHRAKDLGLNSENLGKHTLDFNTDSNFLKDLEGFEIEKLSNYEIAALKAYVIKEDFHLDIAQVRECLLMRTDDYAKVSTPESREMIDNHLVELSKDKNKVNDILTKARIDERNIERDLFSKLPYSNSESTKQRITKRNVEVSKAKVNKDRHKLFNRQLAQNVAK